MGVLQRPKGRAMELVLDRISKTYDGRRWAVEDLSLSLRPGAVVGVAGPNGAGKSTTLRILAAVLEPTRGEVRADGRPVHPGTAHEVRRRIGFLGDGHALYRDMTPRTYLEFFGRCHRMGGPVLARRVDEVLETFSLTAKARTPIAHLSKGMRQRLVLARCFLHEPEVLVVDEPADGLDPTGRAELRRILRAAADAGAAVVIASHILRELDGLCDTLVVLAAGRGRVVDLARGTTEGRRTPVTRLTLRTSAQTPVEHVAAVAARHDAVAEPGAVAAGEREVAILWRRAHGSIPAFVADLVDARIPIFAFERTTTKVEEVYATVSAP